MNKLRLTSFFIALVAMIASCTKVDLELGKDLVASTDKVELAKTAIEDFKMFTTTIDSIPTSTWGSGIIGSVVNPVWGQTSYSFVSSLMPYLGFSYDSIMGVDPVIDSVILSLYPVSYRGDTTKVLDVSIYDLEKSIPNLSDSIFYSNFDYSPYIGSDAKPIARMFIGNNSSYEVALPIEYGERYLDTVGGHYLNDSLFVDKFPGLLFKTDKASYGGVARNIDMYNSGVKIYYHNHNTTPDTTTLYLAMRKSSSYVKPYITMIENDLTYADPVVGIDHDVVNDSLDVQTTSYIRSQGGLMTVVEFNKDEFDALKTKVSDAGYSSIAVSSAVLTIPIKEATPTTLYNSITQLGFYTDYQGLSMTKDYKVSIEAQSTSTDGSFVATYYDGLVNRAKQAYILNISSTIQSILSDEEDACYRFEIASGYSFDSSFAGTTLDVANAKMDLTYVMVR